MSSDIVRRDFLKWTTTAAATGIAATVFRPTAQAAKVKAPKKIIPIGVQLWSVREECKKDFDATLGKIAEMGFQGVEFAGYYNYAADAAGLRKKLDSLGLKAAGTHVGAKYFLGDELKKTVEFHKTIGCPFLIVPGDGRFTDPEKSKVYAEEMTKAAEALKPEGMACGHHNHTHEFDKVEGKTYWDLFGERTSKDVFFELDIGWVREAGLDPVELIKRNPGRIRTTHIKAKPGKDKGKFFIGQDNYDWKRVIKAAYDVGGTEWFLIEQEDYPDGKSPMECTKISLDGLKKILKGMKKLG